MRFDTHDIVDVFHGHAKTSERDCWSRHHVHGLSLDYLNEHGFPSEEHLISEFKRWLKNKNYLNCFANAPHKESRALRLNVCDIGMSPWELRQHEPSHLIALRFKEMNIGIFNKKCCQKAHSLYRGVDIRKNNNSEMARARHGYHCSLYDCYELYLCFIMS